MTHELDIELRELGLNREFKLRVIRQTANARAKKNLTVSGNKEYLLNELAVLKL
jgi:hypothetical protein